MLRLGRPLAEGSGQTKRLEVMMVMVVGVWWWVAALQRGEGGGRDRVDRGVTVLQGRCSPQHVRRCSAAAASGQTEGWKRPMMLSMDIQIVIIIINREQLLSLLLLLAGVVRCTTN